jgi:hypothetical protein
MDGITGRRRPISIFGAVMIAAISVPSSLVAAQEMPEFLNSHLDNIDHSQADHVNIDCHRNKYEMNCHFVKIFLLDPKTPEKVKAKIEEQIPYWMKDAHDDKKRACNWLAFGVDVERSSAGLPTTQTVAPREATRSTDLLKAYEEAAKKACDEPTEDNFREMMRASIRIENATCEIVVTTYDTKFKMQSDKSWVSNSGEPKGFCGEVDIETLHKNPQTQDASDWIYEVRAIFTKPNGPLCSGIKAGTDQFTKNITKVVRNCEWIKIL